MLEVHQNALAEWKTKLKWNEYSVFKHLLLWGCPTSKWPGPHAQWAALVMVAHLRRALVVATGTYLWALRPAVPCAGGYSPAHYTGHADAPPCMVWHPTSPSVSCGLLCGPVPHKHSGLLAPPAPWSTPLHSIPWVRACSRSQGVPSPQLLL